ncbi:MAG: histidine kinase [Syntrophales bacterium]
MDSIRAYLNSEGLTVYLHNASEWKKMEEAVQETRNLYTMFILSCVVGTFRSIYNPDEIDGFYNDCNDALARILGCEQREDMLKLSLKHNFFSDQDLMAYVHDLMENKCLTNYQLLLKQKDREPVLVLLNANLHQHKDGLIMVEGTMIDITEHVHTEFKLMETNERLKSLVSELVTTEERERKRIASDLHDNVGQTLAVTKIKLESLLRQKSGENIMQALVAIENLVNQSIRQTRSMMTDLSPSVVYEVGFVEAIEWLKHQIHTQYGLQISLIDNLKMRRVDREVQLILFRATRELLFNVIKHARVTKAYIRLRDNGKNIHINIRDNESGFDISTLKTNSGTYGRFGLCNIRERLTYLGGLLEIDTRRGEGASLMLMSPRRIHKRKKQVTAKKVMKEGQQTYVGSRVTENYMPLERRAG